VREHIHVAEQICTLIKIDVDAFHYIMILQNNLYMHMLHKLCHGWFLIHSYRMNFQGTFISGFFADNFRSISRRMFCLCFPAAPEDTSEEHMPRKWPIPCHSSSCVARAWWDTHAMAQLVACTDPLTPWKHSAGSLELLWRMLPEESY
jgi:hypothetical protein